MIEVTLSEIINAASVMQELAKKPMRTKAAYKVARLMRELEKEYSLFQESRRKLIEKYGVKNEDGSLQEDENGNYSVEKDNIPAFNKELEDMLQETLTLNVNPIKIEEIDNIDFTPADMVVLGSFIENE